MNTRYTSAILSVFMGLSVASCTNMPNVSLPGTQQNAGTTTAGHVPQALPNHHSGSSVGYQNASYNSNTSANTNTNTSAENYSYANYGANNSGSGSYYDNYDSSNSQNTNYQNSSNGYSGTGSYYDTTTGSSYDYNGGTVGNMAVLPGGAYAVQILATVSNGKASDLQRQMESMGYPAVVDFIDGLHKVRIPYQSKTQAHANLDSIRSAANEPQAFVATR